MKNLLKKEFIIGMIVVIFLVNQNDAAQIRRRRATPSSSEDSSEGNDLDLESMLESINSIPYGIGPSIKGTLNYMGDTIILTDQFTNGLISRLLGGALPCEISIEKGTVCSGIAKNGGPYGVVRAIVYSIPDDMLPTVGKDVLLYAVKIGINPFIDFLLGGLPPADN